MKISSNYRAGFGAHRELLLPIAIIAFCAGMLLPAIQKAKAKRQQIIQARQQATNSPVKTNVIVQTNFSLTLTNLNN